ncbi:MAG: DUF4173 domain-containing protein [Gemmatimonadetes bacterium]|nr:DUF4173 domain-containing protein [Gemmatimonadota bacterium]
MRTRARQILLAALLLGVVGDQLLRGGMPRLGFALLVLLGIGCVIFIGGRGDGERSFILLGVGVAALGLVVRDSEMLFAVDMASVLCMGALAVWHGSGRRLSQLALFDPPRAAFLATLTAVIAAPQVLRGSAPETDGAAARATRWRALAIGTVLAVPPLFIVASLLGSADVFFARFLQFFADGVDVLFSNGLQQVVTIAVLAWLATGWMQGTLGGPTGAGVPEVRSPSIAFTSVSVALYGLVVLLALFLGTQARVLFGGAAYLDATAGLTVAEYARSGFFQLVIAGGVVIGTLLLADWLTEGREDDRRYRAVGTVLVLLVAALLGSAVARMWLYVRNYGLSTDRAFAIAQMGWVFAALGVFAATVLRGRRSRFVPSLLVATVAWVALLNAANPEAIVVRVNAARAASGDPGHGRRFDVAYHAHLSADALPALLAAAPSLPPAVCEAVGVAVMAEWERVAANRRGKADWRGLDLPLARALAWRERRALPACGGRG